MKKCRAEVGNLGNDRKGKLERQRKVIRTVGEVVRTPTADGGAGARDGWIWSVKEGGYCAWEEAGDCSRV